MRKLIKHTKGGHPYKDVPMMAAEGVHEEVGRLVDKYAPNKRDKLKALDIGAGQGALSLRIRDLGFSDVAAWELEHDKFKVKDIPVKHVDLNHDFPAENSYDVITAIEILEHLENPFHFFRQIGHILAPGGFAIVSTPNIEGRMSRLEFLLNGNYRWFDEGAYQEWGHILPLSRWQLDRILNRAGLGIAERSYNSRDAHLVTEPGFKNTVKALAAFAATPLMTGDYDGDISLFVVKRAEA